MIFESSYETKHAKFMCFICFYFYCLFVCGCLSSSSGWRYGMNGNSGSCRLPKLKLGWGKDGSPFQTSLEWLAAPPPTRWTATGEYPRVVWHAGLATNFVAKNLFLFVKSIRTLTDLLSSTHQPQYISKESMHCSQFSYWPQFSTLAM